MTPLRDALAEYLELRRALGYRLARTEKLLGQFCSYLEAKGAETLTVDDALVWARLPEGADPSWWSQRLSVVRSFARYLSAEDDTVEVPPTGLLPGSSPRAHPYLYTDAEVARLLAATRILRGELRRATYATLLGLLASTGMRVGEAIALDCADVDVDAGVVLVRRAKGTKTRELPLHASVTQALSDYLALRVRQRLLPETEAFFVSPAGTRLLYCGVHWTFHRRLIVEAGIEPRSAACRPRIHDLRHRFAVNALLDAYREGLDVARRLSLLATYLGHVDPAGTYWYLSAAPELLGLAAARLEEHAAKP
ncbi:MAG: tyrosine-type recombinase/integrase [Gaiellaceae bacterium]